MLSIERLLVSSVDGWWMVHTTDTRSRYHGMYCRQMCLAFRAAVDALAGEIATILHAHFDECSQRVVVL